MTWGGKMADPWIIKPQETTMCGSSWRFSARVARWPSYTHRALWLLSPYTSLRVTRRHA